MGRGKSVLPWQRKYSPKPRSGIMHYNQPGFLIKSATLGGRTVRVRVHGIERSARVRSGSRIADLVMREKLSPSYVALLLRLTFLAPDITRAILEDRQPGGFTAQTLVTYSGMPLAWPEQRQALGFA
jgi:hypothetical protein